MSKARKEIKRYVGLTKRENLIYNKLLWQILHGKSLNDAEIYAFDILQDKVTMAGCKIY